MKSTTTQRFWKYYSEIPSAVKKQAKEAYGFERHDIFLKANNARVRMISIFKGCSAELTQFELTPPDLDWIKLANGMSVPAERAETTEENGEASMKCRH